MPSSTATPTASPTETPIPTITPTATESLSAQEQLERDYGRLVLADEKCVKFPDVISNPDNIQSNVHYTILQVRATDPVTLP